jgi:hypothetical protein
MPTQVALLHNEIFDLRSEYPWKRNLPIQIQHILIDWNSNDEFSSHLFSYNFTNFRLL